MTEQEVPIVVYHAAAMGNWKEVVQEQLALVRRCGLADALASAGDVIRLTHVGQGLDWILEEAAKQNVPVSSVRSDPNTDHYETFAIMEIEHLAKQEKVTRPILYFHTKGVASPHDPVKKQWRRSMGWNVVHRWRENMELLRGKDAVGQNYCAHGQAHFSGNFWLASPDWIRCLPSYVAYHNAKNRERWSCELWLCCRPGHKIESLGCLEKWYTQVDYSSLYPKDCYPANADATITWVTLATPDYAGDLARLVASTTQLGAGNEITARVEPCIPFRHTIKFDLLRALLPTVKTTHLFWIDADCEFVLDPRTEGIIGGKPLTAVRHFCFGEPQHHLPRHLIGRIKHKGLGVYWQSCLFGGEVEAMRELLEGLRWMDREGVTYDEHGFVIEINRRADQVDTLPCRFACPSNFNPYSGSEQTYRDRACGPPVVMHHNRNTNR